MLARLGGDEFIILLRNLVTAQDASIVANRMIDAIAEPFSQEGHIVSVSCSVGISVYPADSDSEQALLKYADLAMYSVKSSGKNNFQFFDQQMLEDARCEA